MGLEVTEIILDIEKTFLIEVPQNIEFTGYVYELEKIVLDLYSAEKLVLLSCCIPENEKDGYMCAADYQKIWDKNRYLPRPHGFFGGPKNIRKELVVARIAKALKYKDNAFAIRQEVARIIKSVCGTTRAITADMHLVKDLGCG